MKGSPGYTIGLAAGSSLSVAPTLTSVPYDVARDLAPIARVGDFPDVLVVRSELDVRSLSDLVARAKRFPGTISFGSAGSATPSRGASS